MRDSFGLVSSKSISVIIPQWWKIDRWTLDTLQCLSFQSPFNYFFGRYSAIRMKNVVINLLLIRCLLGWTKLILLHLSPFQIFLDKVQASFWCHYRQATHCTDITNISYLRYLHHLVKIASASIQKTPQPGYDRPTPIIRPQSNFDINISSQSEVVLILRQELSK